MLYLKPKITAAYSNFHPKLGPARSSNRTHQMLSSEPNMVDPPLLPGIWGEIKQQILNRPELSCKLKSEISKFIILKQNCKEIKGSVSFLPKFLFCLALARRILTLGIFKVELIHLEVLYSVFTQRVQRLLGHVQLSLYQPHIHKLLKMQEKPQLQGPFFSSVIIFLDLRTQHKVGSCHQDQGRDLEGV